MRILVVEDQAILARQVAETLRRSGYAVDIAGGGVDALHMGSSAPYDAIVLDLGLPEIDGLSVLKRWREDGITTPVLILTARGNWHERVEGIDAGADDYLVKPFHFEELLARLRAVIRRGAGIASSYFRFADIAIDARAARVTRNGESVPLTAHEYRILAYLAHHAGRAVSRSELAEHLYAEDRDRDSNTIDVFVARLRRKLGHGLISTVRGLGYRLEPAGS
ncbi:MAG: response regulator transcription factor [Thermoanaerobaculia bacterium]|nr:response regulator transcription factor [Thermoanaerobaculia bacterium]